ncbi:hypothetical protein LXL04_016451 [Taraxacum kok-saghyz]
MGIWDVLYFISDGVKRFMPDLSTVRRTGDTSTSTAVTKIDQKVRVDGIQKLTKHWPQITLFTTTLAKNSAKYAVYEGFKHIPGATVVTKLVSDTMHEVKQQDNKDGMKADDNGLKKDLRRLTPDQGTLSINGKLRSQNPGEGEPEKAKDVINVFMKSKL